MNVSLLLEPVSLARLRRVLRTGLVGDPAARIIRGAAAYVSVQAEAGAPRDTGAVATSFRSEVHPLSARVMVSSTALPLEGGRRAGAPMPPPEALKGWAERHGLQGLEFVIARAIARRGIKGRFFMRRARQKLKNEEMPRLMTAAIAQIKALWRSA